MTGYEIIARLVGYVFWIGVLVFIVRSIAKGVKDSHNRAEVHRRYAKQYAEEQKRPKFPAPPDNATPEQLRAFYRDSNQPGFCWICGRSNGQCASDYAPRRPCQFCKDAFEKASSDEKNMPEGFNMYNFDMLLWGKMMIVATRLNDGEIDEQEARRQTQQAIKEARQRIETDEIRRSESIKERNRENKNLEDTTAIMRDLMS